MEECTTLCRIDLSNIVCSKVQYRTASGANTAHMIKFRRPPVLH